jgi:excisionase family DNA binding protein
MTEPFPDPLDYGLTKAVYTVRECEKLLNICRSSFYRMVNSGELRVCRFGTRTLVQTPDLLRFLAHLRERGVESRPRRPADIASRLAREQGAPDKEAEPAKNGKPLPPPSRSTRRKAACEERV